MEISCNFFYENYLNSKIKYFNGELEDELMMK